ncbi:MAG: hypothetical protein Q4A40_06525 [Bacillota bacterium]|nr:hypothetical protein [Bacillota bacterium]
MKKFFLMLSCIAFALSVAACADMEAGNGKIIVSTEDELRDALRAAEPAYSILLREGIYEGDFRCETSGMEDMPIQIASYPGERATVTLPKNKSGAAIELNGRSESISVAGRGKES